VGGKVTVTHLEVDLCPNCGARLDTTASIKTERKPKPGDFSICMYCGAALTFDEKLLHVKMTDEIFNSEAAILFRQIYHRFNLKLKKEVQQKLKQKSETDN
jgi:hypothetical protein